MRGSRVVREPRGKSCGATRYLASKALNSTYSVSSQMSNRGVPHPSLADSATLVTLPPTLVALDVRQKKSFTTLPVSSSQCGTGISKMSANIGSKFSICLNPPFVVFSRVN